MFSDLDDNFAEAPQYSVPNPSALATTRSQPIKEWQHSIGELRVSAPGTIWKTMLPLWRSHTQPPRPQRSLSRASLAHSPPLEIAEQTELRKRIADEIDVAAVEVGWS
jgi:hypothetical protein